jgi:hypothetical protein
MSSLGDIQQIHSMLQQISKLLDEVDTKTDVVTQKSGASTESLRKLELVAVRYLAIAQRLGLPEDVQTAVDTIARLIVLIRQAHIWWSILQTSMGPIGWASFAAGGILLGFSVADTAGSFM